MTEQSPLGGDANGPETVGGTDPARIDVEPGGSTDVATRPAVPEQAGAPAAETITGPPARRRLRRRKPKRQSAFRRWRKTRPFWGGLLTMLAGAEIALLTAASYELILISKSVGFAIAVGAVIFVLGLTMWLSPVLSKLLGLLTLVAALLSFVTSNLGGFLIGMLLAIIGGGLSFAWEPGQSLAPTEAPVAPPEDLADEAAEEDGDSESGEAGDQDALGDVGTDIFGIPEQRAPEAAEQQPVTRDDAGG